MKEIKILFLLFLIIVFFTGLYLYSLDLLFINNTKESMENPSKKEDPEKDCPDLLINKGNSILLYNTKQPEIEGKNPIPFYNLDEYIQYLEIQKKKGIHCPVLYLQQENNTQGKDVYRIRPGPFDMQGGIPPILMTRSEFNHQDIQVGPPPNLSTNMGINGDPNKPLPFVDANRNNPPYNAGNYAGFDPSSFYVGKYTELDAIHDSTEKTQLSDNPMDSNWAGVLYTESAIQSGKYEDNNIVKPTYYNTKNTVFHPNMGGIPPPPNFV